MKALRDSSMSLATARELLQSQKDWHLLLLLGTFLMSLLSALHDILLGPKKAVIKMDSNMKWVCSFESILRSLVAEGISEVSD